MGLYPLLQWCIESFAPEAESAARWADNFMAVPDRKERGRRMVAELSARVAGSGTPRDFVLELPGVRGKLPVGAAYLAFRIVKIHLYVAGAHAMPLVDFPGLADQSLLLMGAELGLPWFASALSERVPASALLRRRFPKGHVGAAEFLQEDLVRRVTHLQDHPHSHALQGAMEFLTLASAADFANAYYDDMSVSPRELEELNLNAARRAVALTGLVKLVARADGIMTSEEEEVLAALREVIPPQDAASYQQALAGMSPEQLPQILRLAEERQGLLRCMIAVASADGHLSPAEEALCRDVAGILEIPEADVDRALAQLRVART